DDVKMSRPDQWGVAQVWWTEQDGRRVVQNPWAWRNLRGHQMNRNMFFGARLGAMPGGGLGGGGPFPGGAPRPGIPAPEAAAPLRVFQDFFVDLDLPVALTPTDEVAFPVAVYNYLKTPQTVRLELKGEGWFDLVDGQGLTRALDLKPNEVTSVKFRIRARRIG